MTKEEFKSLSLRERKETAKRAHIGNREFFKIYEVKPNDFKSDLEACFPILFKSTVNVALKKNRTR